MLIYFNTFCLEIKDLSRELFVFLTLQKYEEVVMAPKIWDILQGFVTNGMKPSRCYRLRAACIESTVEGC